jgi:hypothetical protein
MKKKPFLLVAATVVAAIFVTTACNNEAPAKESTANEETSTGSTPAVTNPNFSIAPIEYSELNEKALNHFSKFEYDAWADMLADNIIYSFPDGDVDTRTRLEGKAAVLAWWKSWKEKSGIESMTITELNHFPLNVTAQPKGGAQTGNYDFLYFSNKMVFGGKPVALRMNFAVHFNDQKKIDRYVTYYDRSVIINATGKNVLEGQKAK